MTPTIIILKANKDRGKTSTLKLLRGLLLKAPLAKVVGTPIQYEDGDDFSIVIDFNNKRIGIISIGDPGYEMQFEKGYSMCKDKQCDIIVVATRTFMKIKGVETPYGLIWNHIKDEGLVAFEISPYITYSEYGKMDKDALNYLCATSIKNIIIEIPLK